MTPPSPVLSTLRDQGAPESHLQRVSELLTLAEREPALLAMFLVGSYARGSADRLSDLDLVAIAEHGKSPAVLNAAHKLLAGSNVLNEFTGKHPSGCAFWKIVYLDFSSVEFHVFEPGTPFRLRRPYLPVWDPGSVLPAYVVDGEPIQHADFAAYEYGDEGLIWELVDCIKWLSRGRNELAKHHLAKVVAEFQKHTSGPGGASAA